MKHALYLTLLLAALAAPAEASLQLPNCLTAVLRWARGVSREWGVIQRVYHLTQSAMEAAQRSDRFAMRGYFDEAFRELSKVERISTWEEGGLTWEHVARRSLLVGYLPPPELNQTYLALLLHYFRSKEFQECERGELSGFDATRVQIMQESENLVVREREHLARHLPERIVFSLEKAIEADLSEVVKTPAVLRYEMRFLTLMEIVGELQSLAHRWLQKQRTGAPTPEQ